LYIYQVHLFDGKLAINQAIAVKFHGGTYRTFFENLCIH
jgi:hypothetical protein